MNTRETLEIQVNVWQNYLYPMREQLQITGVFLLFTVIFQRPLTQSLISPHNQLSGKDWKPPLDSQGQLNLYLRSLGSVGRLPEVPGSENPTLILRQRGQTCSPWDRSGSQSCLTFTVLANTDNQQLSYNIRLSVFSFKNVQPSGSTRPIFLQGLPLCIRGRSPMLWLQQT